MTIGKIELVFAYPVHSCTCFLLPASLLSVFFPMPTRFSSFSISQLLNNFYYEEFVPRACVTKKRRRIQTKPALLELMESYGSYKTLRDFYYGCIDKAKAGHLYLDLAEWFQDLQAAGFPARDSEAWQIASFPTEEIWAAK